MTAIVEATNIVISMASLFFLLSKMGIDVMAVDVEVDLRVFPMFCDYLW